MARIDYYGIQDAIKARLTGDATLAGVRVEIEEELPFDSVSPDGIVEIYLERRDAPADMQSLSAGQQTRMLVTFSLWAYRFSLEAIGKAAELRDDLIGLVEVCLMGDRTLGGTVITSYLAGGSFDTKVQPSGQSGWAMGGEITLVVDVKATR